MYPHERSLVKRLEGKPFVILGVNSDEDRDELKQDMKQEGITWRSFWNGGSTDGPILSKWKVGRRPWVGIGMSTHCRLFRPGQQFVKHCPESEDRNRR